MKTKSALDELRHTITDYFILSQAQRRGSLFLLFILLFLCSGFYFVTFFKPRESFDSTEFKMEVKLLEEAMAKAKTAAAIRESKFKENPFLRSDSNDQMENKMIIENKTGYEPVHFNPNTADEKTMIKNGLSSKQAQVLIKFRLKGGKFRKKEDLKKIYSISASQYSKLEPFITIPNDTFISKHYKKDSLVNSVSLIVYDLNTVSQSDLDSIKGIGPNIASSIIAYRDRLGGYIQKKQLFEVYGMDSILFNKITNQLEISGYTLTKININKGFEVDLKHPYMTKTLSKLIINYRKLHGPFSQVEDLRKLALVNEELYVKLAPYLTVE